MATAIRNTVVDYSQPLRPHIKRPFSETHIARNIQAQRLESGGGIQPFQTIPTKDGDTLTEETVLDSDIIEYYPTTPATKASYQKFISRISEIMAENGNESFVDDNLTSASNLLLFSLKHSLYSENDNQEDFVEVLNKRIRGTELQDLKDLADDLNDYPVDQSLVSDSTTLNTSFDQSSTLQNPQKYRDVETINENSLTAHTYTGSRLPAVDILVRTSGVERLSDFLLWQCHERTDIIFVKSMWPEFGLRQFIPIILEWQWRQKKELYWRESKLDWEKLD
jgi:hypothetical protein